MGEQSSWLAEDEEDEQANRQKEIQTARELLRIMIQAGDHFVVKFSGRYLGLALSKRSHSTEALCSTLGIDVGVA